MFYIYNIIPKTLLTRFVLIIIIPIVIGQLTAVYLFYDRHWYNVSSYTSSLISNEIKLLTNRFQDHDYNTTNLLAQYLKLKYEFYPGEVIPHSHIYYSEELEILQQMLNSELQIPSDVRLSDDQGKVIVDLQLKNGFMRIYFSSKTLMNPTTYIFVLWILFLTLLLLTVSLIFSKNQIRSILELAKAADEFGRGIQNAKLYKPSGAREIRRAGLAFIRMRDRIERQSAKRTQMLAMISHDLRTPLTRIKLQIELMPHFDDLEDMKADVENMEQMISGYLDFARGEGGEFFQKICIGEWIDEHSSSIAPPGLVIEYNNIDNGLYGNIKPQSFKRALANILGNAAKYATKIRISIYAISDNVIIDIEDNGPGVSDEEKNPVFKAFYRSDQARHIETDGSVGLGLAITKEIILGHNGAIVLKDSINLGGLLVRISLPLLKI